MNDAKVFEISLDSDKLKSEKEWLLHNLRYPA